MFKIGLYEREITPLFGNSLCGYFNVRLVDGVKEKTYAKAVVIEKDTETIAMLAIDACESDDGLITAIRERVKKYIDIKDENILIAATHSHTAGPGTIDNVGTDEKLDNFYLEWLSKVCADTIVLAYQRRADAKVKFTKTEIYGTTFVRNYEMKNGAVRTNPGIGNPDIIKPRGEVDYDAPVFFFEGLNGENLGMMYSFANHQDSVDGTEVSGDWSSIVSRRMKEKFGMDFISVFFIGTAGNINQVDVNNKEEGYNPFSYHHVLGNAVADALEKAFPSLKEIDGEITVITDKKLYKNRVMSYEEIAEQEKIFHSVELPADMKLDASSPKAFFDACMARRALNHTYTAPTYYPVKFQIIKIADIMIFALPGEVFTQYGLKIKAAFPNNTCFFACIANNKWSYMPAPDCYFPELYESLFGSAQFWPEDTADIFDHFIELGKKL